jgi:hypothetical protein
VINKDKVIFYATYLQGSAYNWFKPTLTNFLKKPLEEQRDTTIETFNSYIQFKINLKKVYSSINKECTANQQIQAL